MVDISPKRIELSESEIRLAKLNSNGKCPVPGCGIPLTDENCQIDHVFPKSKSSKVIPVAICDRCNRRKSNWSKMEFENYQSFVETFENLESNKILENTARECKM